MSVVEFGGRRRKAGGDGPNSGDPRDQWLKRQANLVVSQLPEDKDEALQVLIWAERIVKFLSRG